MRRNLTLSGGLRYEAQTHVSDFNNLMPRLGVTWAVGPQASPTTLRASWGIFHDWLSTNTYEQTLRVDGFRQQEIDIFNPSYPVFSDVALAAAPVSRYVLGEDVVLPRSTRLSLGVDKRFKADPGQRDLCLHARRRRRARREPQRADQRRAAGRALWQHHRGDLRRQLAPAPVADQPHHQPGRAVSAEQERAARRLQAHDAVPQSHARPARATTPMARSRVAPTGDLDLEWGPANNDVRQRFNAQFNNQIIKNLGIGIGFNMSSASPYTIRTGLDDNGDLIFNDRPAGVPRNTERGTGTFSVNMNLNYNWQFGPPAGGPPGIGVFVAAAGGARSAHLRCAVALPHRGLPVREQPDQSRQLRRLQRRHDVAVLQASRRRSREPRGLKPGLNFGF